MAASGAEAHPSETSGKLGLTNSDYTVGWICALSIELAASTAMLDEQHPELPQDENDSNAYTLGRIGPHNVVLACLPSGTTCIHPAAIAAANLLRSFPKIRFGLMVGVGGGAPSNPSDNPHEDLRLGDVVVSNPEGTFSEREFRLVGKYSSLQNQQAAWFNMALAKQLKEAISLRQAH
jgi:hypothetical protein